MNTSIPRSASLLLATVLMVSMAFSCKTGKPLAEDESLNPRPDWMTNRPVSGAYFIGIGSASKTMQPLDFDDVARKNALNDLAQGIRVRVQGNTFLNSLEVNKAFSEEFISNISTTTDEEITDFEVAGQWENKSEFWVYYRLNKAQYYAAKQAKKDQAMRAANDFYQKGHAAEQSADIPSAFDLYLHGLLALRDYWNEVNEFATDTGVVFLENEIYASLQRMATGLRMGGGSPSLVLSVENNYVQSWQGQVLYEGKPARGVTVTSRFPSRRFRKPAQFLSDTNGRFSVSVSDVDPAITGKTLRLNIDMESLIPADLDRKIASALLGNLRTETREIPITLMLPAFYVQSSEKNFGQPAAGAVLQNAVREGLSEKSYRLASSAAECDFVVLIESNTTQGGTSQGFFVTLLEYNITVKRRVGGEVVFQKSETGVKGLQLNYDAASAEAYKKTRETLKNEVIDAMLAAIL